jgi:Methyltransferase domain
MTNAIEAFWWRARNAIAKRIGKRTPKLTEFAALKADYPSLKAGTRGRFADLLFSNEAGPALKWLHYPAIYDQLLQGYVGSSAKILEIGVYRGGSQAIWRKFFGTNVKLFGIDIDPKCAAYDGKSGSVRIGSQDDYAFLHRTVKEMGGVDIVMDDGSHVATHQRTSFETLFPLLSDGGLYLIEDAHTSYWTYLYEGGLKRRGTIIEFMKDMIDGMHRQYYDEGANRPDVIPEIESIQFFDSIIAIRKRRQQPRAHVMIPEGVL